MPGTPADRLVAEEKTQAGMGKEAQKREPAKLEQEVQRRAAEVLASDDSGVRHGKSAS